MDSPLDKPPLEYDLEEALPYLMNRAGVHIGNTFSQELVRFGITLPMFRILASLSHRGSQRLTELAEHTTIELSTLSRLIGAMERKRLLTRRRSGSDARSISIAIDKEGQALIQQQIPLAELYERIALSNISAEDVALLKRLLKQIYANIRGLGPQERPVRSKR